MITVIFEKNDQGYTALYMNGHSGYSEVGTDIICSSASILFYTAVNSLIEMCGVDEEVFNINEDKGDGEVNASFKLPDLQGEARDKAQTIMGSIHIGFKTLEEAANIGDDSYLELIESRI